MKLTHSNRRRTTVCKGFLPFCHIRYISVKPRSRALHMATFFTILLLCPLALASENDFQVIQESIKAVSRNRTVTIVCECSGTMNKNWILFERLNKSGDAQWSCKENNSPHSPDCSKQKESWNRTVFTLSNVRLDTVDMYVCEFSKVKPTPVIIRTGKGTYLFPETECPMFDLLTWLLVGVAAFFCMCSLVLASVYVRLKRKKRDVVSNGDYVDMREVHTAGSGPGRDVNYNSQNLPFVLYQPQ